MASAIPVVEQPYSPDEARPLLLWAEAGWYLEQAQFSWLATVQPDARPHVVPVLAVWLDGAVHFCSGAASRKARNLARDARCVITVDADILHLVIEGEAVKINDEARLQRVAEAYRSKYGWQVTVRDNALYGDGAPTAGPPPYEVYAVTPTTAFGFGTDDSLGATRWRF